MAPTVSECKCVGGDYTSITAVKEYVRYHLGEFPFTTARKIGHLRCKLCNGITDADSNKELINDMCKNRAFIAEQDRTYSAHAGDGDIKVHGWYVPNKDYTAPQSSKQWQRGVINYLRMVNTGEKVIIIPTVSTYLIYCSEEDRLSIAAKQFVKPDDYFKLTSIQ